MTKTYEKKSECPPSVCELIAAANRIAGNPQLPFSEHLSRVDGFEFELTDNADVLLLREFFDSWLNLLDDDVRAFLYQHRPNTPEHSDAVLHKIYFNHGEPHFSLEDFTAVGRYNRLYRAYEALSWACDGVRGRRTIGLTNYKTLGDLFIKTEDQDLLIATFDNGRPVFALPPELQALQLVDIRMIRQCNDCPAFPECENTKHHHCQNFFFAVKSNKVSCSNACRNRHNSRRDVLENAKKKRSTRAKKPAAETTTGHRFNPWN